MMANFKDMEFGSVTHVSNKHKVNGPYPALLKEIFSSKDTRQAFDEISKWKGYNKTPLYSLKSLAHEVSIGSILYKDEGPRFGLGSFKALGGAYGVKKYLDRHKVDPATLTVATATDGNHGRAVAWGAKMFGCKCRIYIHSEVSEGRKTAMEALGADVIRIEGNYDDSVRLCTKEAEENGWMMISDTSFEGYTEVPKDIMAGYSMMGEEITKQLETMNSPLPTHIFLQGGVGGLASALCSYFWERFPNHPFRFIIVEPKLAPCLIESAREGKMTEVDVPEETIMAGLSCGVPSFISWEILDKGIDDFIAIDDNSIPDMMRLLANPFGDDPKIIGGESGVAGLAGLLSSLKNKTKLDLDVDSTVLLIGTEGATDPEIYEKIVGVKP